MAGTVTQFTSLMAAVRLPAILVDAAARIAASNEAARVSFGDLPPGALLHLRFRSPELRTAVAKALQDGRAADCDIHIRVPDERWYKVEVAPIGSPDERYGMLLFQDVSEAHKIERMRADFIANASHELRTPLASLTGFIETLRGPARDDPAARDTFLAIMTEQAGRMARLIDDLLSLSRLEMRPFARLTQDVDLVEVARQCAARLAPVAQAMRVTVVVDAPGHPLPVSAIPDEIHQALDNLLENACKYGRSGGKAIVGVRTDASTGDVSVSVQDFGPGIAAEHLPRLTERFYRADAPDRAVKGTGLGLAIVKHIVSRHHGRLLIESTLGEGSIFTIRLPRPGLDSSQA